ncbi:hypothetical protein RKD19_003901 [Streptomyces canus]
MSTVAAHPEHGPEDPCPEGVELYARALREGGIDSRDAAALPCLLGTGLLRPAARDAARLEPVPPAVVLHRMLRATTDRVAHERRREERLAEAFAPLLRADVRGAEAAENPAIRVVSGTGPINEAISAAMTGVVDELLCVQPNVHYSDSRGAAAQAVAMSRDQALLDRGARIRTLYQHTQRHMPLVLARYEQLSGDVEARSLDEVTDRLIVADRDVAFIPADGDGTVALEVRHLGTGRVLRQHLLPAVVAGHAHVSADRPPAEPQRRHPAPTGHRRTARGGPHRRRHRRPARHEHPHRPRPHRQTRHHPRQREPRPARLPHRTVRDS